MHRYVWNLMACGALLALTGCATLNPDFETPTVTVNTIRVMPTEGITPQFEIGLHIINPNRTALKVRGIAYSLKLEGYRILTGVTNDLPVIEGYGEGDVTLLAATSLLSSIRFFTDLMNTGRDAIAYELDAKLDLGGIQPNLHVGEKGEIRLPDQPH